MNETEQSFSNIYRKTPVLEPHFNIEPATLLKKRPWHRRFPVNFAKSSRTAIL